MNFAVPGACAPAPSYFEATARRRVQQLLDAGSWREFLPPPTLASSPHLAALDMPGAFDDGVVIGAGLLGGKAVLVAAQEGRFMGGAVGEIHGAKIVGLLRRALAEKPAAVLLLADSGGVRLHEANAGLIAISEIMRAVLAARAEGIAVLALIGGSCGAFGGMAIVCSLCSAILMSEEGRLGLSGPEVIETVMGVEEFDAKDRALVWRVTGGKHRYLMGDCADLVDDSSAAFRQGALDYLNSRNTAPATLGSLRATQQRLRARLARFGTCRDGSEVWAGLGISEAQRVPLLDRDSLIALKKGLPEWSFEELLDSLFPAGHAVTVSGRTMTGTATTARGEVAVLGTTEGAALSHDIALTLAEGILATVERHPGRTLILLVDTSGQALSRQQELLCLNGSLAHLAQCVDLARRQGHASISLVSEQAVSGGYLSFGLMADRSYACSDAQVRVMDLKAMARVTKIAYERLAELAASSAIIGPGAENYRRMGAIEAIWEPPFAGLLLAALDELARAPRTDDRRISAGLARGGRQLAAGVAAAVLSAY